MKTLDDLSHPLELSKDEVNLVYNKFTEVDKKKATSILQSLRAELLK